MRLLALVTDAFGGRGGIAKFNRDLPTALCSHPGVSQVVALPRVQPDAAGDLPDGLVFRTEAVGSKGRYVRLLAGLLARDGRFDGVVCGHLNLLPLGYLAAIRLRVPLLLVVHGIEAWKPTRSRLTNWMASRVDALVAVSDVTRQRFVSWTNVPQDRTFVVPNCIDPSRYGAGPKRADLLARYGLAGKRVILTLGRLSSQERYKGIDEVLEVLPALTAEAPDLAYLIVGDGDDRPRLAAKAASLGVADRVVFAGYVPEAEKADHYRLADAFVMPGYGEGFGIVYLEALACGLPVVASSLDASKEAVRDGELGVVVDPKNPDELKDGIREALRHNGVGVPEGLTYFTVDRFRNRWHRVIDLVNRAEGGPVRTVLEPMESGRAVEAGSRWSN